MKIPSPNIQAPEKLQISTLNQACMVFDWSLKLGISLDVGVWNLEL